MSEHIDEISLPVEDTGLRCIGCEYNFTGLTSPICPECGIEIDWPQARAFRDQEISLPGTYWDSWSGYTKPVAFILTALQVAFLPWVFARRLPNRPRLNWAVYFAVICCVWLSVGMIIDEEADRAIVLGAWLAGMWCHIILQVGLFWVLLPLEGIKYPARFWMVISCYTSYPILIEVFCGGPPVFFGIEANTWPMGIASLPLTFIYYWWWIVLAIIAWTRLSPRLRWRIVPVMLGIVCISIASTYVGVLGGFLTFAILGG